jgi:hypothetical protein
MTDKIYAIKLFLTNNRIIDWFKLFLVISILNVDIHFDEMKQHNSVNSLVFIGI